MWSGGQVLELLWIDGRRRLRGALDAQRLYHHLLRTNKTTSNDLMCAAAPQKTA